MSPWVYICALVFVAFWALFAWLYNSLVRKRLGTENAWSQIEVQLKRRHDLIPNLVETVRGYASHEKDTLERVIQARNAAVEINSASMTEIKQVEDSLSSILRQLFAPVSYTHLTLPTKSSV